MQVVMQAIKIESGFVFLALVIFLLSIFPFCWSMVWCLTHKYRNPVNEGITDLGFSSMSSQMQHNEMMVVEDLKFRLERIHMRKRSYVATLQTIVIITLWVDRVKFEIKVCSTFLQTFFRLITISMFIVNEQAYTSINRTPTVIKSALKDIEFFIQSTQHQLQSDIFGSFDETTERMKTDLEGEFVRTLMS